MMVKRLISERGLQNRIDNVVRSDFGWGVGWRTSTTDGQKRPLCGAGNMCVTNAEENRPLVALKVGQSQKRIREGYGLIKNNGKI